MSTAFVVGGSGGIGAEIARVLAREGWDIALTYHSRSDRAEAVAGDIRALGRDASIHQVDLADTDAVLATAEAVRSAHGAPGCLVYAAGPLVPLRHLSKVTPAQMKSHLLSDTFGFFNLLHACLPDLRETRGNVVACQSAAQVRYAPADGLSVVPKAGVGALMSGIAKEEGRFGIRANGVGIGLIESGQMLALSENGDIDDAYLEAAAKATPLRRLGAARDIAEAVAFLASDERAGFVTGQVINVDGGYGV
ncbi:SDR family NAD(P)-dependent oxidoreductase [Oceanibium sediminis]|uniref:SDR family NAD(P)-dependent oxidoreductase n=1 Tax=Oceanibium sediminis TaxID=2026339 RepID=UPI000DD409F4|nr:SDR family oxidoreductase [Oceanibium sediminis]